jgi:hypothetical protein
MSRRSRHGQTMSQAAQPRQLVESVRSDPLQKRQFYACREVEKAGGNRLIESGDRGRWLHDQLSSFRSDGRATPVLSYPSSTCTIHLSPEGKVERGGEEAGSWTLHFIARSVPPGACSGEDLGCGLPGSSRNRQRGFGLFQLRNHSLVKSI